MKELRDLTDLTAHDVHAISNEYTTRDGSEAGSYVRPIDCSITQLKAQGPSGTCNESKEEE